MTDAPQYDVIVVGSGITGGWAAKEFTEAGFKVLMIERGRNIEHMVDYTRETLAPWDLPFRGKGDPALYKADYPIQSKKGVFDEWTQDHFVNDRENPYQASGPVPFQWTRSYQTGGRSLTWGRQCYRWSDYDFGANKKDGHGSDWPVRYADLAKYYDKVESFIGVSGSAEGIDSLPDGQFQRPFDLNVVEKAVKAKVESQFPDRKIIIGRTANLTEEKEGRGLCQSRDICARGCSYGAYFSTQSSTLPAAQATNNLTLITDSLVEKLDYDPASGKVSGVRVINSKTKERTAYTARVVFLNAGSFNSTTLLLRSTSEAFPKGLANRSSGMLGQYILDHAVGIGAVALIPGFDNKTTFGNRPNGIVVPKFRNVGTDQAPFMRGYSFQGGALQSAWTRGERDPGLGKALKDTLHAPGGWRFVLVTFAECLPRKENRLSLDANNLDPFGLPQMKIDFAFSDNETALLTDASAQASAMMAAAGGHVVFSQTQPNAPGSSIHEMGGARMANDPKDGILNAWNQVHDVPNLFVTDGAAMASSASQNPSLTYMALTVRAAERATALMRQGVL
jgi:choline dehydrogenase-like flavoprotein